MTAKCFQDIPSPSMFMREIMKITMLTVDIVVVMH